MASENKDTMAATITRIPKTQHFAGKWIEGTWDNGYTWSALVFTEPSDYGIPEFRHISKLYLNPPGQKGFGDTVLHYERGWDPKSKPTTALLKRALNDIGRVATAYAQKWARESDDHSNFGKKDKMAVEDRFYFGKGRKERFGYNWWSQQQQELVPAASRASSSARTAAADLQRLATRLEAQGKFLKSVKQQDLTGTNQKLYDAVYEIISDIQKVKDLLGG